MAKVPNGVETLPKISIAWVGCMNVTDDRQTDGYDYVPVSDIIIGLTLLETSATATLRLYTSSKPHTGAK